MVKEEKINTYWAHDGILSLELEGAICISSNE